MKVAYSDISGAGNFAAAKLNMNIALAQLNSGSAQGQICDVTGTTPAYLNNVELFSSSETGSDKNFKKEYGGKENM